MEVDISFNSLSSGASGELESDLGREALREICCSSLSRILDLSDNKLEILLGEEDVPHEESSGSNVAKNIANKLKALSHRLKFDDTDHHHDTTTMSFPTLTFGSSIDTDSQIVLLQFMSHMENFAYEEGVFRKPGSHSRVEQLIHDLGAQPFDSVIANKNFMAADYASVLKSYFKDLPEPLMLRRHMEAYKQASTISSDTTRTLCLQLLMLLLPPSHHTVLSHLLHLLSIISHTEESRMNAYNLAVIFGPTLFFDTNNDDIEPELIPLVVSLLQHMISHNVEIFEIPTEVRLVAEQYIKRKGSSQCDDDIPVYSSACKRTCTPTNYHDEGRDNAVAELASLYEHVKKMPEGPQKQYFLKKFESGSKMAGTPPPYVKMSNKKLKENKSTPKVHLSKGVGSHQIKTPMRPLFKKQLTSDKDTLHIYATPLKPKANLMEYQHLETDI